MIQVNLPAMHRIQTLAHADAAIAVQVHHVLQLAYAQEARLLGLARFPPLDRRVADVQDSAACHLGAHVGGVLAGVLAYGEDDDASEPPQTLIEMLLVHPDHQRQGIASALLDELLRRGAGAVHAVATAAANAPALALYARFGFVPYRRGTVGPEALPLLKLRREAGAR
jgi:GNAT superfamily N-acetyltransferase